MPKVSIIISNRNDVAMLSVTVRSCIEELKPLGAGAGEIIIVDNSDENIYKLLASALPTGYCEEGLLRIHRQNFPCLFTARELAIEKAKGEYVICVDSHVIIGRDMIVDLVDFMDSKADDPTVGFAHAPVNWAHQHERASRHDRDMSECELGNWSDAHDMERTITWKGMPWICRRDWFLDKDKGLGGYGALSEHKLSWGGGDMHIGIKPWLLGFKNWAVPCSPAIHIGPFPKIDKIDNDNAKVGDPTTAQGHKYRLWASSGVGPHAIGFLVSCYVLGGEFMMERNQAAIKERFGRYIDLDKWWGKAISYGKNERQWLDKRKIMTFENLLMTRPWDGGEIVQKPNKLAFGKSRKYSVIIPYQHSVERVPLLKACLDSLSEISNLEVCVHEIGPSKTLRLSGNHKCFYTKYSGIFHRAWAINRGVKMISSGNILILMDGDLVVTKAWADEVSSCDDISVGWGRMTLLTEQGTKHYLRTGSIDRRMVERSKSPSMGSAAGGIMIISRDAFYAVKGIPEDFTGSWGGEDNAFWTKLRSLGYKIGRMNSEVFHLHHSKSTPRVRTVQRKALTMFHWGRDQWEECIRLIGDNWGTVEPENDMYPSVEYISVLTGPKLTLAMLSWLRYEKLVETLTSLSETLTIPINIMIMVQGSERLEGKQRRAIRELAYRFDSNDVYFTKGNVGTGPARKTLTMRALARFKSPYINLSDDDTTYTPGSVEAAIDLLDSDMSIGVVGIRYKSKVYVLNSTTDPTELGPRNARDPIEYVDSTGSASAFMRREIFDHCKIDPQYVIGQWDLDLFLQARSLGWKIVNYKGFEGMRAINNWGGCPEYRKARINRREIVNSVHRFKRRWGLRKAV